MEDKQMKREFSCYTPSPYFDFRDCGSFHPNPCAPNCDCNHSPCHNRPCHTPRHHNCNKNYACMPNDMLWLIGGIIIGNIICR